MFRFEGAVHYLDGTTVEFECGNVALAAWERYAHRHKYATGPDAPATVSSLVVAHHALGIETAIAAWEETVDGVELRAKATEHDAASVRKVLGLAEDSTDADVQELVSAALARAEELDVPPTRPEPSPV